MKEGFSLSNWRKVVLFSITAIAKIGSNWKDLLFSFPRLLPIHANRVTSILILLALGITTAMAQSPVLTDTDGDGFSDNNEINNSSDFNDPCDPNPDATTCCTFRGRTIDFLAENTTTDSDHTTFYILTNSDGIIETVSALTIFDNVAFGLHYIYAINYQTKGEISGMFPGQNITDIQSPCIEFSEPIIFQNCPEPLKAVSVTARVFLQGSYVVDQLMRDQLRQADYLPLETPYATTNLFNSSNEETPEKVEPGVLDITGQDAIVDWVFLELRDANDATEIVASRSALLQRDGDIVDIDGISAVEFDQTGGNYYLAVRHRNHLGAMTAQPLAMVTETAVIDFTLPTTPTWGIDAQKELGGVKMLWGGNTLQDDKLIFQGGENDIDPIFYEVLQAENNSNSDQNYIKPGYYLADANMDGNVIFQGNNNDIDFLIFFNILTYQGNTEYQINYIIREQLP